MNKKRLGSSVLLIILLLAAVSMAFSATPVVAASTQSSIMSKEPVISSLNYFYYSKFVKLNQTFTNLYQKALELGVDNETLQMVLNYQQAAEAWYRKGLECMNPMASSSGVLALIHFRKAYVSIRDAIRILENAIEELENSKG